MSGRNKLTVVPLNDGPQLDRELLAERRAFVVSAVEAGDMPTAKQVTGWLAAMKYIGRVQAALVSATVAERIIAESYIAIVESKTYIGVPYDDADGSTKHISSLNEFCEVFFGKGARRCQQMAANLEALGADLYEAGEKIGLGQRDYNALRALPADDQAVVKAALAEGSDKSAVLDLLNELASRLQEAKAEKEVMDRRARDQIARNNELSEKLSDAMHFWRQAEPNEQAERLLNELYVTARQLAVMMVTADPMVESLRSRIVAVREHAAANGNESEHDVFLTGVIAQLIRYLDRMRSEMDLPEVATGSPALEAAVALGALETLA